MLWSHVGTLSRHCSASSVTNAGGGSEALNSYPSPDRFRRPAEGSAANYAKEYSEGGNGEPEKGHGLFRPDNRMGIDRTLHRISAIRNISGDVIGLTYRIGRHQAGAVYQS